MPFNGSGTYSLPSGNPVVTNTPISSTVHNATTSDIASALTNCVTRDGQSPPTAPLPMGNQKITGLAKGTVAGDAVRYEQAAKIDESTGANSDIKSLSGLTTPLSVAQGGTGSSTAPTTTGTGSVVLNNSPTLILPVLGTPSSGNLSNCTFPTLNQNTTGSAASATTATSADGLKTASGIVSVSSATAPTTGQVLVATSGTAATWQSLPTGTGTVTSVAMTVPSFLSVTGSPVTSTGTLAVSLSGTALPVANGGTGNTTGTATINANLTGAITSVGNAASLGSFTSANLAAALTDETGTAGKVVFDTNPTFPAQINLTANSGYNINASGTADNYLAGSLGIGTLGLTGYNLRVDKQITGSTNPINCYLAGEVQTAATGDAHNIYSSPSVVNATFTLPALYHFRCVQGTFGASASVTNQFGFNVTSNCTGATNNYGFYGGIAAGANRYNLVMAGSADNYLAGNLGVGVVPVSSITAVGAGQTTASLNTSGTLGGTLIVGDSGSGGGNGGAIVFSGASTAWRFAAIKGMATNGASNSQGDLVFSVRPSATDATLTEAFRIYASKNALFSGSLGVGSTTGSDTALQVNRPITSGNTEYMIRTYVEVPSNITNSHFSFSSALYTQAAAFTLGTYIHYDSAQGTIGAGSAITNQYGFFASSSLTGATNNYGFYGGIAAGTNRYNLYMAGSADNYLAGKLMVGSAQGVGSIYSFASGASNGTIDSRTGLHIQNNNVTTGFANARIQFSFATNTPKAYIEAGVYGDDYLAFGSTAGATENMRIDSSGNVGIGTSSPDASSRLTIGSTPSVSSPNGQLVNATFSSAATGVATGYLAQPSTAAASFTVGTMAGFKAAQGTKGSGSTITLQTGFLADTSLIDGVNNAGFYGNIAAASGRFNFYASGTAVNAFSGDVNIFGAGKLGYTTGSGGTVTQTTSRTTNVTLDKTNGSITLVSAAGSATYQSFLVYNSTVSATDVVVLTAQAGLSNKYNIIPYAVGVGVFGIHVAAVSGTTTEAPIINFAVIKAVNA